MIELYQFGLVWGINPSPFCLKVDTYLRLVGLPYRTHRTLPNKAPKGKLPYIVDEGTSIPDSGQIIAYLKKRYGDPLDQGLDAQQQALGHLVRRTCEESLFFPALYSRWIDEPGWTKLREGLFAGLPPVVRSIVPGLIRRRIAQMLRGQGTMRHNRDEIYQFAIEDVAALVAFLGDKPFILGPAPSSVDATLYAFALNLIKAPIDNPLNDYARGQRALVAYVKRMDEHLPPAAPDLA